MNIYRAYIFPWISSLVFIAIIFYNIGVVVGHIKRLDKLEEKLAVYQWTIREGNTHAEDVGVDSTAIRPDRRVGDYRVSTPIPGYGVTWFHYSTGEVDSIISN